MNQSLSEKATFSKRAPRKSSLKLNLQNEDKENTPPGRVLKVKKNQVVETKIQVKSKSHHMELWVKIDILSTPSNSKSEVTLTNMHYAFLLPFYFYFQCHFDTRFSKKRNLGPGRRAYQRKLLMSSLHTCILTLRSLQYEPTRLTILRKFSTMLTLIK